ERRDRAGLWDRAGGAVSRTPGAGGAADSSGGRAAGGAMPGRRSLPAEALRAARVPRHGEPASPRAVARRPSGGTRAAWAASRSLRLVVDSRYRRCAVRVVSIMLAVFTVMAVSAGTVVDTGCRRCTLMCACVRGE